jgi:N-acetylmuramoyl-L-alanine amidase
MPLDLPVHDLPLPYVAQLVERRIEDIDLVVIHCTELPDLAMARSYGERVIYADSGTGASGHWYIERDGRVHRWVPPQRVAHHTRGFNPRSVGIELVNTGRYPDWFGHDKQVMTEPYPEPQIVALVSLLVALKAEMPNLRRIAGHEDLDLAMVPSSDRPGVEVPRKRDPGPMFPWERVLRETGLERIRAEAAVP